MTSTAFIRAGMLHARRSGKSVHLRDRYEPEDLSILSTVMGITQEVCAVFWYISELTMSQTINHRRLVQEIYDKRTLHKVLGLSPRAEVAIAEYPKSSKSELKIKGSSVRSAWREAEYSDEDAEPVLTRKRRHDHRRSDDEEEGRYGIAQPLRKRQRMGGHADRHTVFVSDDDEEDDLEHSDGEDEGGEEEESEVKPKSQGTPKDPEEVERKRDYWLSKGFGFGTIDDTE